MEPQKPRNKNIINLIYVILSTLLGFVGVMIMAYLLIFIISLSNPDFERFIPITDIPLKIAENATLELKSGAQSNIFITYASIGFNINEEYGIAGVLNFLALIFFLLIAYYIIFLLWKIFRSIRKSLKKQNVFDYKNVWRIRYIAIAIFLLAVMEIMYPVIIEYAWFDKVILLGKSFDLKLNFDSFTKLFWSLVVVIIAEIYRIGLEMKKDQELTI
ncbi:MAG: DUF2975 domain-containing protein [Bacteroidales bacterium]|nr:DUF2975 domain-containing protein [Bacteroidales bacterium]